MQPEEVSSILDIIPQQGMVLEIGTFHGMTAAIWAAERPNVIFFSVDPMRWRRAGLKWYVNRRDNMRLLTGTIDDLAVLKVAAAFDVIVVDGDHTHAACYHDLEVGLPLLKPAGRFVVHDYAKGTLRRTCARGVVHGVTDFCKTYGYRIDRVIETTAFLEKLS